MKKIPQVCAATKVFNAVCYTLKFADLICVLVDFMTDQIIDDIQNSKMISFEYSFINFSHHHQFRTSEISRRFENHVLLYGHI